jgi:hypothetical protein
VTCWNGPSSDFETALLAPFSSYALEQLRQRFLFTLVSDHTPVKAARVLLQMTLETEIGVILVKQVTFPAGVLASNVCERRHYVDIDQDMQLQRYLVAPALDALAQNPRAPLPYVDFIARYTASGFPRYRMSALAVALCIGKVVEA